MGVTTRQIGDTAAVVSSTTLVNTGMSLALEANSVYGVHSFIVYDTNATADYRWGITLPAGASALHSHWAQGVGGTAVDSPIFHDAFTGLTGNLIGGVASGTFISMRYVGTITTVGTAGNMVWQHAQATSTAVNTITKGGSWMHAIKLA